MPVYDSIDDVPSWDSLSDFDSLTVAEKGMVLAGIRIRPAASGGSGISSWVLAGVDFRPAASGGSGISSWVLAGVDFRPMVSGNASLVAS